MSVNLNLLFMKQNHFQGNDFYKFLYHLVGNNKELFSKNGVSKTTIKEKTKEKLSGELVEKCLKFAIKLNLIKKAYILERFEIFSEDRRPVFSIEKNRFLYLNTKERDRNRLIFDKFGIPEYVEILEERYRGTAKLKKFVNKLIEGSDPIQEMQNQGIQVEFQNYFMSVSTDKFGAGVNKRTSTVFSRNSGKLHTEIRLDDNLDGISAVIKLGGKLTNKFVTSQIVLEHTSKEEMKENLILYKTCFEKLPNIIEKVLQSYFAEEKELE